MFYFQTIADLISQDFPNTVKIIEGFGGKMELAIFCYNNLEHCQNTSYTCLKMSDVQDCKTRCLYKCKHVLVLHP